MEGKFDTVFSGLSALSFGIGVERSFYYEIDTLIFYPDNIYSDAKCFVLGFYIKFPSFNFTLVNQ